ncbi:MAG TPA: hypothetical protein VKA89_08895 [Solirubrobacterales bacterium]|nr:hypothetical protein [Solirubrobacterales bacterium]
MKPSRARFSLPHPSTAISVLALCLALAGTAIAANTIGSRDVRNNSLTGKDIRNKSLTKKDFKGSVRGPRGPQGATGPTGPAGTSAVTNVVVRLGTAASFSGANPGGLTANCNAGERAVGGGVNVAGEPDGNPSGGAFVVETFPLTGSVASTAGSAPTGWYTALSKQAAGTDSATAYVVCASP